MPKNLGTVIFFETVRVQANCTGLTPFNTPRVSMQVGEGVPRVRMQVGEGVPPVRMQVGEGVPQVRR